MRGDLAKVVLAAVLAAAAAWGCDPLIGDHCTDSLDCSEDGDRYCDTTQPGGYCIIPDCYPDTCPKEAVCVQFFDDVQARTFCMKKCKTNKGCERQNYYCLEPQEGVSEIIDTSYSANGYCAPRVD